MKPFSFIHAADLHLGSAFKGVGSKLPEAAEQLRAATFEAFTRLVDLCLEKAVAFLLVAGDVFDSSDRNLRAQLAFRDGLARLSDAGVHAFTVLGNHDPWESWSGRISWPEKAHLFSPDRVETRLVAVDETPVATVSGISYRNQRQTEDLSGQFAAEYPGLYQIALLHANCGNQPEHGAYAPCSLESLRKAGFDYWALGHVHERKVLETRPHIVYPGCIQGLSIRETGPHGCWHVSVTEEGQANLSFLPLDRLRWRMLDLSINGLNSLDALDRTLSQALSGCREAEAGRPVLCRLRLSGRGALYSSIRQPSAADELLERFREVGALLSPPVWIQDMEIACRPEIDLDRRRAMEDLLGQVLRGAAALGDCPETLVDTLMPVLSDLYNHARLSRYLQAPSASELQRLLQDAALLCLDRLEGDL